MVQKPFAGFVAPITFLEEISGVKVFIKRDDQMHPAVSGNKLYKLRFNIEMAQSSGKHTVLTFGGAYSNHLAATAAYCKIVGLKSVGIVRGERPAQLNPTLEYCQTQDMQLEFISRSDYRRKSDDSFLKQLERRFDQPYIIPEGGSNLLGIAGSEKMLDDRTEAFDHIVSAVGTGTTLAGLLKGSLPHQSIIGIPIHKHGEVMDDVKSVDSSLEDYWSKLIVWPDYHFGGYAKFDDELIQFIRSFHARFNIPLDPIYTGKALFALKDQIKRGAFEQGKQILFIHTGGLQGINGFEQRHGIQLFGSSDF